MVIFELVFLVNFLKLSVGNRFWNNLRNTDNVTYKAAIQYQRCLNKTRKCQLDLEFLYKCKKNKVNPKFVRWKNISSKNKRNQQQLYRRLLSDAINEKL